MTIIDPYVWQMQQKYGTHWNLKKCNHKDCEKIPDCKVFFSSNYSYLCRAHATEFCNFANRIIGIVGWFNNSIQPLKVEELSHNEIRLQVV